MQYDKRYWNTQKEYLYKLGGFLVHIASPLTRQELERFVDVFEKTIFAIQKSPIKHFKKVLRGHVYVGTKADICEWQGCKHLPPLVNGQYSQKFKVVNYFIDGYERRNPYLTMIHEFAHKLHVEFVSDGLDNQEILDLYDQAINGEFVCDVSKLPKIGDPLSDFQISYSYGSPKNTEGFYLTEIEGVVGEGAVYTFMGKQGLGFSLNEKSIIRNFSCPST